MALQSYWNPLAPIHRFGRCAGAAGLSVVA